MSKKFDRYRHRSNVSKIKVLNTKRYRNLVLTELKTKEERERHQGYRYLVRHRGGVDPLTAFNSKKMLDSWMRLTGIRRGTPTYWDNTRKLVGSVTRISLSGNDTTFRAFCKRNGLKETKVTDNGEVTRGCLKEMKTGVRIYHLNPNYDRKVYPWQNVPL